MYTRGMHTPDSTLGGPTADVGRRPCPPHGAFIADTLRGWGRGLRCLGCGAKASSPEDFGLPEAARPAAVSRRDTSAR